MMQQIGQRGFSVPSSGTKKPAVIYELMMEQINIFNDSKLILV